MSCLLKWLIGWPWCAHKWKIIDQVNRTTGGLAMGRKFYLQCEKCGDLASRSFVNVR